MVDRNQKVLALAGAIYDTFTSSEWTEIGYLTDTTDWIDSHPRLLRSLHWGDSDYKGHVFEAVSHILDKDPANIKNLLEYAPIADRMKQSDPGAYQQISSEVFGTEVPHVVPSNSTDSALAALADAQTLLSTRGPTSAVDRLHTGLHGFLRAACDKASIAYPTEPTANQLLKALIEHHPSLIDLGPRTEDIRRMIKPRLPLSIQWARYVTKRA